MCLRKIAVCYAGWEEDGGGEGERAEVEGGEPENGFDDVGREGDGMEKAFDGLDGEIDRRDFFTDNADSGGFAKRDEDEMTGLEFLI